MLQPPAVHPGTDSILWALPVCQREWELTPPAVQDYIKNQHQQIHELKNQLDQLQQQIETLQGQLEKTSQTSNKPPSSDSPFTKPKRQRRKSSGKRGGQKGHCGKGPTLLSPTEVHLLEPGPCTCGHGNLVAVTPYYTHQVIELPPIEMKSTMSSSSRASAKDVGESSKRRCQVTIRPGMARA